MAWEVLFGRAMVVHRECFNFHLGTSNSHKVRKILMDLPQKKMQR